MQRNFYKLGFDVASMPPSEREGTADHIRQSITQQAEHEKMELQILAHRETKELQCIEADIQKDQREGISDFDYVSSYRWGLFFILASTLITAGEFFLVRLTLAALEIGVVSDILAAVLTIGSVVIIDRYLHHTKLNFPQSQGRSLLAVGFFSSACFLTAIGLFAVTRSKLFQVLGHAETGTAEDQLAGVTAFETGSRFPFMCGIVATALGAAFASGLCLHEGTERVQRYWTSPPYKKKKAGRVYDQLVAYASGITAIEANARECLLQFRMGVAAGRQKAEAKMLEAAKPGYSWDSIVRHVFSPVTLIIVVALVLLIVLIAHAAENVVLVDRSMSMLPTGFDGRTEFEKNREGIRQMLLGLGPGDSVTVASITCSSFSRPEILLQGKIPTKEGYFKESTLRARIDLLKNWDGLKISPDSRCTDVFGAIALASTLFGKGQQRKLIIFSDMRHNTGSIDLETPASIKKGLIDQVQKKGLPDLGGAEVYILGVHSFGKDPLYYQSLREFWLQYFGRADATVKVYSMERKFP